MQSVSIVAATRPSQAVWSLNLILFIAKYELTGIKIIGKYCSQGKFLTAVS